MVVAAMVVAAMAEDHRGLTKVDTEMKVGMATSRAAARLHISQPAVSRQIRDLEDELGVALFDRAANGLRITEAGQTALSHAKDLLRRSNDLATAMQAFGRKSGKTMSIQIGFVPTALPGFLAEGMRTFFKTHAHVCLQIHEMSPQAQEVALAGKQIDLALIGHASE